MSDPRLLSVATAVPPHLLRQSDVQRRLCSIFRERSIDVERFLSVFDNAGIDSRYSCVPLEWYEQGHGWSDRNPLYLDSAVALLQQAAERALRAAGLVASDIDGIVAVSTSGIATPSLDARLMERMGGFRRDVFRLPIFGLGCAGGVLGLARAARLAKAVPEERILFLVVEPCALTFCRSDYSKSNIVATALFGDGAAAAVVSCTGDGPAITAWGEYTWPGTLDVMGWEVEDDGLRVVFSRDIPGLVHERVRAALDGFLGREGLGIADIDQWLCHPGGAKVLDALEDVLEVERGALDCSRSVLRDYGNMSAATVMFVLARALGTCGIGRRAVLSSLGPGFTAAFLIIESERPKCPQG